MISFHSIKSNALASIPYANAKGDIENIIYVEDTKELYVDHNNTRTKYSGDIEIVESLPVAPLDKLYLIKESGALFIHKVVDDAIKWIQLNKLESIKTIAINKIDFDDEPLYLMLEASTSPNFSNLLVSINTKTTSSDRNRIKAFDGLIYENFPASGLRIII